MEKKTNLCEKYIKLFFQSLFKLIASYEDKELAKTRRSSTDKADSSTVAPEDSSVIDLSIDQ